MKTDITEEKLEEIGFVKIYASINPTYYAYTHRPIKDDNLGCVGKTRIGKDMRGDWHIYSGRGDCVERGLELSMMSNVVDAIARNALILGMNKKARQMRRLLRDLS